MPRCRRRLFDIDAAITPLSFFRFLRPLIRFRHYFDDMPPCRRATRHFHAFATLAITTLPPLLPDAAATPLPALRHT